ncbi:MAG: DNA-formamidopyrimidine glycosylase family protein [Actinomycetota bacterium]|nr:DNA-formamidopyrimidine glycosylase family protein [Actinomycetota bacterium]
MPELIEVETYLKAAGRALGRTVATVSIPNSGYLAGDTHPSDLRSAICGHQLQDIRRIGKLLIFQIGSASIGMRFGMTGRLVVDGEVSIGELLYTTNEIQEKHVRCVITFQEEGEITMIDPRSFGKVELQPDETRLGPDAMAISTEELLPVFHDTTASVKALLLDQTRIAGLGNLLCDEITWRSGVDPQRAGHTLEPADVERLASVIRATIEDLSSRGGSHMGDLQQQRHQGGTCPTDGVALTRGTVAGRTTWWCPEHQL